MANLINYSRDTEFSKLLSHSSDIDVTIAALELARDAYPNMDFQETLGWINARARELQPSVSHSPTESQLLHEIGTCIAEEHGIFGDSDSYTTADSSFLNRVIETKRGIPISLSILYIAVARELGLDMHGVGAPMHFIARCETSDGPLFIDAFSRGRIMSEDECCEWLHSLTGLPKPAAGSCLKTAGPREIILRMLNNLKAVHATAADWEAVWLVQNRLTALQPASYQERRDLGIISAKAKQSALAIKILEPFLATCEESDRELLRQHLDLARNDLARWN